MTVSLALVAAGSSFSIARGQSIQVGNLRVELERIINVTGTSTLFQPLYLDTTGDNSGRLFISEQTGRIRAFENGTFTTFLDIRGETFSQGPRGLLGFTFHPGFSDPESLGYRKLYSHHTVAVDPLATVDFPAPGGTVTHHNLITEWQVDANNPNIVDLSTRREIFRHAHVDGEHSGGMLEWGPDGYLYGTIGAPPAGGFQLYAQHNTNLFGTIFRIDPIDPTLTPTSTDPASANGRYRIPGDNPFVGDPSGLDEIFAYGLRNPYRFSIDQETGYLFAGDVGQGSREEVSVVPKGGNMGWPYREGTISGTHTPPNPPPTMIGPIAEYTHADGRSVIGGFVYRGFIPELQGKYIFGEFSWGSGGFTANQGRILWFDPYDELGNVKSFDDIRIQEISTGPATCANTLNTNGSCRLDITLLSFGIDDEGELYILGMRGNSRNVVYKVTSAYFLPDGDYNQDGAVDAADYVVWRSTLGSTTDLRANGDDTGDSKGIIDQADLLVWQANFGATLVSGTGAIAVPEPYSLALFFIAGAIGMVLSSRRHSLRPHL